MTRPNPALASFNAARASHGLPPVSALPGREAEDAVVAAAEAVVAAAVGWDEA